MGNGLLLPTGCGEEIAGMRLSQLKEGPRSHMKQLRAAVFNLTQPVPNKNQNSRRYQGAEIPNLEEEEQQDSLTSWAT